MFCHHNYEVKLFYNAFDYNLLIGKIIKVLICESFNIFFHNFLLAALGRLRTAVALGLIVSPQGEARYVARPASQSKHSRAGSGGLQVTTVDRTAWAQDQAGPDD